jgi:hypothetical protein
VTHPGLTDEQLVAIDVPEMLGSTEGWFADVAVAAAIQADRFDVQPRSLTFLAEIVRRGGLDYAARLAEPLPTAEQSELVRSWLAAAHDEVLFARWLDAVGAILLARRQVRLT